MRSMHGRPSISSVRVRSIRPARSIRCRCSGFRAGRRRTKILRITMMKRSSARDAPAREKDHDMSVRLNHTIVWCRDKRKSATFLTEVLGLPAPNRFGPFLVVELRNGVSLDFHEVDGEIASQHYAFLVGEKDFDAIFARISERDIGYWADP